MAGIWFGFLERKGCQCEITRAEPGRPRLIEESGSYWAVSSACFQTYSWCLPLVIFSIALATVSAVTFLKELETCSALSVWCLLSA